MQHPHAWLPICRDQKVACVGNGFWVLYLCCHYICAECLWSRFVILPPHYCATNQGPCVIPISNYSDTKEHKWAESPESSRAKIISAEHSTSMQGASSYWRLQSPAAIGTLTLHLLLNFCPTQCLPLQKEIIAMRKVLCFPMRSIQAPWLFEP